MWSFQYTVIAALLFFSHTFIPVNTVCLSVCLAFAVLDSNCALGIHSPLFHVDIKNSRE